MSEALLVADSGPLIALARLNLLALPSRLFRDVLVTATVWHEVTGEPRALAEQSLLHAAQHAGQLRVIDDPAVVPRPIADALLDAGEHSAIAAATALGAAVLVDDKRGRTVAARLGLPVIGTLGLLVRARDAGLIDKVRPLAEALLGGGYFLARPLVERTLAAIGE